MSVSVQKTIQDLLDAMVAEGSERGVQVCVYQDGRLIVDAWSGVADFQSGRQVDGDTLFPIFSVTKGMAATIVHRVVERGLLSYDTPIAQAWPEFAQNGKDAITLSQGLNHSAGIPHMPQEIGFSDVADWNRICSAVAGLAPIFPPGSRTEYHAITFGWIVGEPACRVTGKSFPQLLEEEIAAPLELDGMYVGIPDKVAGRVAVLEEYNLPVPPEDPYQPSSVPGWLGPLHEFMNRPDMQRACIPGSSGIMNARSIARHYAALLPGGVDGIELLPPARVRGACDFKNPLDSQGEPPVWPLGYQLHDRYSVSGEKAFGHGGYGGSMGFADPGRKLAVGIAKNLLNTGNTADRIFDALAAALEN